VICRHCQHEVEVRTVCSLTIGPRQQRPADGFMAHISVAVAYSLAKLRLGLTRRAGPQTLDTLHWLPRLKLSWRPLGILRFYQVGSC
jgi:hypothetical protein